MEEHFSGAEVVEVAIEIERNGETFYAGVAAKTHDDKLKRVFDFLAEAEREHRVIFEKLLHTVRSYDPAGAYPEEYFGYLNALAVEHVFTRDGKGAALAAEVTDDRSALDLALGFEKKTILYFEGMKRVVPSEEHSLLDMLIEQEKEHIKRLLNEKERRV